MGQYYKAVLVDNEWKINVIRPSGWKLMEHSYYWDKTMKLIEKMLDRNAMNVMWIWDYSQVWSLVWKHEFEDEKQLNYDYEFKEDELLERDSKENYYLVNKSRKEFINMTKQEEDWYKIHPLPLLCSVLTEEACWDYHWINKEYVWKRAWDIISIYHWWEEIEQEFIREEYQWMTNIYFFKE